MAVNKEIDEQVRKDIRTLSATLTRETGVSPLATSSDAREHLSDVDAIVALLTTATDGDRVVAVTASRQANCIETLLVTRDPRDDYGISESVVAVEKCDVPVETILKGWLNSDSVPWEEYVRDLITLMNDWHLYEADELSKLFTLHLFILRRCYHKLVVRMLLGEKLWGDNPFSLIHKWLTTQPVESFKPFTVKVTSDTAQYSLQEWNISPSSAPNTYTVDRNNVTIWFDFLRKQYSNVRRCLVETDSGKSRARRSVLADDLEEVVTTLAVLQNIAVSRLVPIVIGAVPNLWAAFAEQKVREQAPNILFDFKPYDLILWKCTDQTAFQNAETFELIQMRVVKAFDDENAQAITTTDFIADVKDHYVFIQIPRTFPPSSQQSRNLTCVLMQLHVPPEATVADVRSYQDVFIKVDQWKTFAESEIYLNDILDVDIYVGLGNAAPDLNLLTELERELARNPGLAPDARDEFNKLDIDCRNEYFGKDNASQIVTYENGSPSDSTSQNEPSEALRDTERLEMRHIVDLASRPWQTIWQDNPCHPQIHSPLKGNFAYAMYFAVLMLHLPPKYKTITMQGYVGNDSWPFHVLVEHTDPRYQIRKYQPKSDFLVLTSNFPRLIVEVNSVPTSNADAEFPKDLVRMLLQGAATVRFANRFLKAFMKDKNFVLVAFYIRAQGIVDRFILFEEKNKSSCKVFYRKVNLNLDKAVQRVEFARQLYNLIHVFGTRGNEEHEDTKEWISKLDQMVQKRYLEM
ncbi:hypothetical protein FISHEDRAFT_72509 [Fistulina hepatica ATCC 64428]|uniref:Uncharacterized protein n=1 Tax=Fistulina hepatica ATCC 64428 TaxID=1128425 RepID=A0A0D7AEV3_9AGAR|nr:hypothetical protein FISHEDRAFT_72509 [Fistulina hepatica ATCC 64428]